MCSGIKWLSDDIFDHNMAKVHKTVVQTYDLKPNS